MRYLDRIKNFPDSCKKEDNPLATLFALRLLIKSQLWKLMDTDDFEKLVCYVPELGEIIYRCNQLASAYFDPENEDKRSFCMPKKCVGDPETKYESSEAFCGNYELPSNLYARLNRLKTYSPDAFSPDDLFQKVLRDYENSLQKNSSAIPEVFAKNLELVSEVYCLEPIELEVFRFLVYLRLDPCLQVVANRIDYTRNTFSLLVSLISRATFQSEEEISKALSEEGNLIKTGLISFDFYDRSSDIEDKIEFSFKKSISSFTMRQLDKRDLQEDFMKPAAESKLSLEDFKHIPEVRGQILPALKNAIQNHKTGCNILLYGKSGTGKTELTRTAAQHLGLKLYSVGSEEEGKNRIAALRTSDKFLYKSTDSLLVVDECDDIFNSGFSLFFMPVRTNKGRIIEALESNARPTFWTCNSIRGIDDAILRRFDIILEMPRLTPELREKIFSKRLGEGFSDDFLQALSENDDVSFAMLDRAATIAATFEANSQQQKENDILGLLNQTLKAQQCKPVQVSNKKESPYEASFANTSIDLMELSEGLKGTDRATICLYGASGTGKSAYVHWLAKKLKKPLIVKRASDILDCYVGNSEKKIARAFEEANARGAILLFDEADSFLRTRKYANHSWEVTQVNEMLTQMENFDGFFIATTNLMDDIDEAALRRFDLKAEFKWLRDDQKVSLLKLYGKAMDIQGEPVEEDLWRLKAIEAIAPGDYGNILKRSRFSPVKSFSEFVDRIIDECKLKRSAVHTNPIGFN